MFTFYAYNIYMRSLMKSKHCDLIVTATSFHHNYINSFHISLPFVENKCTKNKTVEVENNNQYCASFYNYYNMPEIYKCNSKHVVSKFTP